MDPRLAARLGFDCSRAEERRDFLDILHVYAEQEKALVHRITRCLEPSQREDAHGVLHRLLSTYGTLDEPLCVQRCRELRTVLDGAAPLPLCRAAAGELLRASRETRRRLRRELRRLIDLGGPTP
jgi:hypothetical protein